MAFLQYPLALIVTLGILVTIHELGHYLIARWSGVRVVRFSVGFGRPLLSRTDRRGTEFVIAAIPLGGYVRMLDARDPSAAAQRSRGDLSMDELSPSWRIAIALGGPLANFILAVFVYWWLAVAGTSHIAPLISAPPADSVAATAGIRAGSEVVAIDGIDTPGWQAVSVALASRLGETGDIVVATRQPDGSARVEHSLAIRDWQQGVDEPDLLGSLGLNPLHPAVVGSVIAGSAAQRAGFAPYDWVQAIDGEPVSSWGDWVERVRAAPGRTLAVTVLRNGQQRELTLQPDQRTEAGADIGFAGVGMLTREVKYDVAPALVQGLRETADKTMLTLSLLKKMIVGQVSVKNLSGPITIAEVAGDSARMGLSYFLGVLALLSISLGVLNLLPIPILDGGHIMFGLVELVRGQPVSERVQAAGLQVGLFLVGGLMIMALFNDITRLFQ